MNEAAHHLVVGTHGRSLYLGNISHLQQMVDSVLQSNLFVFDLEEVKYRDYWGDSFSMWRDPELPGEEVCVYSANASKVKMIIQFKETALFEAEFELEKGLNYLDLPLEVNEAVIDLYEELLNESSDEEISLKPAENEKYYLKPGDYTLSIQKGELVFDRHLSIYEDD